MVTIDRLRRPGKAWFCGAVIVFRSKVAQEPFVCQWIDKCKRPDADPLNKSYKQLATQVDELAAAHRRHVAESRALQEGRALLAELSAEAPNVAAEARAAAAATAAEAAQEFIHSACRHLYFQRAEAQLLLRKLLFCAAELHSARLFACHVIAA